MKLSTVFMPLFAVAVIGSGCASTEPRYESSNQGNVRSSSDRSRGVIESIEPGRSSDGNDSALLGTVVGGVVGAAAGHQVGDGRTNDVATVAGAVGGAVVGRKIDQAHDRKDDVYRIGVRLDDGSRRTITQAGLDGLRVGDSVRIDADGVRAL